ncbi:MAG: hypothetical protein GF400_02280, partial [Candidatus Eisenbacteria bacterium]|nr:hypothetical protein [Candidatus Eisenbacteria bacterium]
MQTGDVAQEHLSDGMAGACLDAEMPPSGADTRFARDVAAGLTASRKRIPCVYLYDARGSRLFEHITRLPEYYLTRVESEIILDSAAEIASGPRGPVQVVELGSGTSVKTITLLQALLEA